MSNKVFAIRAYPRVNFNIYGRVFAWINCRGRCRRVIQCLDKCCRSHHNINDSDAYHDNQWPHVLERRYDKE